jgi:glycosyltransferase involved in cell wall biosynthesis
MEPLAEPFACRTFKTVGTGSVPLFAFDPRPVIDLLTQFKPDVVDVHEEPYSVSGFESLLLAKRYAPDAACVFYSAQNIKKNYPPPFCWSERFVYENSQGAYPCSTSVQEVLLAKGFSQACPVIGLGVNPLVFSPGVEPLQLPHAEDQLMIGFTGRLLHCKGVGETLRAVAQLKTQNVNVHLVVAGAGQDEQHFRALANQLGLDTTITWLGELNAAKMPSFYTTCDTIVVPSITTPTWREQFGRVPVEAMACGVPVIVSDSGSLVEVVADAGIVVPEQDHVALAQALLRLKSDAALRTALIDKGQRRVEQDYTWSTIAQSMLALYRGAIKTKRATKSRKGDRVLI